MDIGIKQKRVNDVVGKEVGRRRQKTLAATPLYRAGFSIDFLAGKKLCKFHLDRGNMQFNATWPVGANNRRVVVIAVKTDRVGDFPTLGRPRFVTGASQLINNLRKSVTGNQNVQVGNHPLTGRGVESADKCGCTLEKYGANVDAVQQLYEIRQLVFALEVAIEIQRVDGIEILGHIGWTSREKPLFTQRPAQLKRGEVSAGSA